MENKKIKILILTDSAAITSGLGTTCRHIFMPLVQMFPDKYELHQLGFFHFQPKEQVSWPIYHTKIKNGPNGPEPDMADKYGELSFDEYVARLEPDIVFAYGDMWHFEHAIKSPLRNSYRLITYYTIDGQPYYGDIDSDQNTMWGKNLSKVDQVVVLTPFGRKVLKDCCKELEDKNIISIPHPMVLNQYPERTQEVVHKARNKFLPAIIRDNAFVCGFIGRNQFRKQNYKLWELTHYIVHGDYIHCNNCDRVTVKEWDHSKRQTKDSAELTLYEEHYNYDHCWYCKSSDIRSGKPNRDFYMWIHSPKNDPGYKFSLHQEIWQVSQHCLYTNRAEQQPLPKQELNELMYAWDAGFMNSGGEGYGNFGIEAMAASLPLIYSNYSSHADFCKFGGLPVRVGQYVPEIHHGIMRSVIDTGDAIKQMNRLIESKELRIELGKSGRLACMENEITQIAKTWDKVFTDVNKIPLPMDSNKIHGAVI